MVVLGALIMSMVVTIVYRRLNIVVSLLLFAIGVALVIVFVFYGLVPIMGFLDTYYQYQHM